MKTNALALALSPDGLPSWLGVQVGRVEAPPRQWVGLGLTEFGFPGSRPTRTSFEFFIFLK